MSEATDFPSPAVPQTPPVPKPRKTPLWAQWRLWVGPALLVLAVALAYRIYKIWHVWTLTGRPHGTEKPLPGMVWTIVSLGVIVALAAAGDIALLNGMRANKRFCRWYFRLPISLFKRVLLLLQLGAMAAVLYLLGVHYLGIDKFVAI